MQSIRRIPTKQVVRANQISFDAILLAVSRETGPSSVVINSSSQNSVVWMEIGSRAFEFMGFTVQHGCQDNILLMFHLTKFLMGIHGL